MDVRAVAEELVAMWKRGEWLESGEAFWADDVVSAEPGGPAGMDPVSHGKAAVRGKGEWWRDNHEVHSLEVAGGPWFNGDQFVVRFVMEVTAKADGQRRRLDETALYTIREGQIADERFFYGAI